LPIACGLAWLAPGLGHIFLGYRARGLIFLVVITATFWTGAALGGVRNTVNPKERKLWFVAQLGTGGNALIAWRWGESMVRRAAETKQYLDPGHWRPADLGVHYTGVAGLLNVLVILDAVARADRAGGARPTRSPDRPQRERRP
jgi:hypothetical protein